MLREVEQVVRQAAILSVACVVLVPKVLERDVVAVVQAVDAIQTK